MTAEDVHATGTRIAHPGEPRPERRTVLQATIGTVERFTVAAGEDLFDALHRKADAAAVAGGAFVLIAGEVAELRFMTGGEGRDGMPLGFHGPHAIATPARVECGAGLVGIDEHGDRFTHCHAVFVDASGATTGGHLLPGGCIAGAARIVVEWRAVTCARMARRFDPETAFTIFHPEAE